MGIQASEKQRVKGICLGLLLLVVIVYAQAAGHDFVTYDDGDYVYANPQVLNGLTVEGVRWAFTTWHAGNWHPLTWLSLMLDAQIYGAGPFGFHFTNVLLHAANVLLLFAALWRMTRALWPAALAAALFAVHPLHVESVAWVSERKDVLSTTFWMLCLLTYAAAARGGGRARWALTAVFMALGLMAKPMLVTLPFALLLLDIWPLRRFPRDRLAGLLLEKTPLFGLSAASCTLTVIAQSQAGAIRTLDGVPFEARLANAVVSYAGYLGKLVWPADLAFFYPHPYLVQQQIQWSSVIGAGLLLALVSVLAVWLIRWRRYPLVGWLWYLGTLVPVIGLVQVGSQALADRYAYVPLIGIYVVLAWAARDVMLRWRRGRIALAGAGVVVLVALTAATWLQARTWRDSFALYDHAIRAGRDNYVAHYNRAQLHAQSSDLDSALADLDRAIAIRPDLAKALINRGNVHRLQRRLDAALADFDRAIELEPDRAAAFNNRGNVHDDMGRHDTAAADFTRAIELRPDYAQAHYNRGNARSRLGRHEQALADYTRAIELQPDMAGAYYNRAGLLRHLRRYEQARRDHEMAVELQPRQVPMRVALAWLLATCPDPAVRDGRRALTEAQRAHELAGRDTAAALEALAAACAELGRFDEATAWQHKALNLVPAGARGPLASRLELYTAAKALRSD